MQEASLHFNLVVVVERQVVTASDKAKTFELRSGVRISLYVAPKMQENTTPIRHTQDRYSYIVKVVLF